MKNLKILFFIAPVATLISLLFSARSATYHQNSTTKTNSNLEFKIDSLIQLYANKGQFNGAVLVAIGDQTVFKRGYGYSDIQLQKRNTPETVFNIASITKQFTAMIVLILQEQGKLDVNDLASDYIDYPVGKKNKITIHQLLNHSSGVPSYTELPNSTELHQREMTPQELFETFKDLEPNFKPGTDFQYSNSGYVLLGLIIEKLTHKTFGQVLKEQILDPLQMNSTKLSDQYYHDQKSYGYHATNGTFEKASSINMTVPYSAGAIESTVIDLKKWHDALSQEKLISHASYQRMYQPSLNGYAFGWNTATIPSFTDPKNTLSIVDHGGSIPGYSSHITRILNNNILIVSLNNCDCSPLMMIHAKVAKIIYNHR